MPKALSSTIFEYERTEEGQNHEGNKQGNMSFNRHARKKDANHSELVAALRHQGVLVCEIESPVDLLCGYRQRFFTVEIKNTQGRNREQPTQVKWRERCTIDRLPHFVINSGQAICPMLDELVKNWEVK